MLIATLDCGFATLALVRVRRFSLAKLSLNSSKQRKKVTTASAYLIFCFDDCVHRRRRCYIVTAASLLLPLLTTALSSLLLLLLLSLLLLLFSLLVIAVITSAPPAVATAIDVSIISFNHLRDAFCSCRLKVPPVAYGTDLWKGAWFTHNNTTIMIHRCCRFMKPWNQAKRMSE